jgi:hypothetical protein
VTEALWPFCNTPVSKLPLFAVAVCGLGPLLSHAIVSPTCTVIEPGLKLKSAMVTPGSAALWAFAAFEFAARERLFPLSSVSEFEDEAESADTCRLCLRWWCRWRLGPRDRTRLPGGSARVRPAWVPRPVGLVGDPVLAVPVTGLTTRPSLADVCSTPSTSIGRTTAASAAASDVKPRRGTAL